MTMTTPEIVLTLTSAVLLVWAGVLSYKYDQQKAHNLSVREAMRVYLAKARNDRNDKVRVPAEQVQEMFDLHEEPILAAWSQARNFHRHPAALSAARRGKL